MQDEGIAKSENLEICPNCMEPNAEDRANCAYCGKPMHESVADNADVVTEAGPADDGVDGQSSGGNAPVKKQEKGGRFYYLMRGMGVYLIITAFTEIPRSLKIEDPKSRNLALLSNLVYIIAGGLLAWPLVKDFLDKRKKKQETAEAEEETIENADLPAELPQPNAETSLEEHPVEPAPADEPISDERHEEGAADYSERN